MKPRERINSKIGRANLYARNRYYSDEAGLDDALETLKEVKSDLKEFLQDFNESLEEVKYSRYRVYASINISQDFNKYIKRLIPILEDALKFVDVTTSDKEFIRELKRLIEQIKNTQSFWKKIVMFFSSSALFSGAIGVILFALKATGLIAAGEYGTQLPLVGISMPLYMTCFAIAIILGMGYVAASHVRNVKLDDEYEELLSVIGENSTELIDALNEARANGYDEKSLGKLGYLFKRISPLIDRILRNRRSQ